MTATDSLSVEEAKNLSDELTKLSKQQSLALQTTAYLKMSKEEAAEYDQRRLRISEIWALLEKFKLP
jgi:hypothetical protein